MESRIIVLSLDAELWDRIQGYEEYCDEKLSPFFDAEGGVPERSLAAFDSVRFDLWERASELLSELIADAVVVGE